MSQFGDSVVEQPDATGAAGRENAPAPVAGKIYGAVGEFETPESLLEAVRGARERGYAKLDAYTPFPIHGIDEALGAKRSKLGYVVRAGGFAGAAAALLLIWWTGAVDYPLVIAGKPLFALEFSIPITFELTVLFAAFAAVFGMLAFNGLPRLYHPVFQHSRFARATNDRFLLAIEAESESFDGQRAAEALASLGAQHVEVLAE
jgi:hypothetical protein